MEREVGESGCRMRPVFSFSFIEASLNHKERKEERSYQRNKVSEQFYPQLSSAGNRCLPPSPLLRPLSTEDEVMGELIFFP